MSSTIFIAVQCYQCSTMQVKQKKKSSNKWSCVVCNQNQSIRKVFAQGSMAKDVRKYVQCFNMSRQLAEQQSLLLDDEQQTLDLEPEQINDLDHQEEKKRSDWGEYIDDPVVEAEIDHDDSGDVNIVTELPKALFKKPKLMNNYDSTGLASEEGEKSYRLFFGKRNADNKINHLEKEPSTRSGTTLKGASKWSGCEKQADKVPMRHQPPTAIGASKWSGYLSPDDDDDDDDDDDNFADEAPWRWDSTQA